MKLSFTEPVCSGGSVLPLPRECPQLRFVMKVSLVYICLMIATLQLLASNGSGQNLDQLKVTTELDHENLSNLFQQIQRQTSLTFAFIPNEISPYNNVTLAKGTRSVKATLELAFYGTGLGYEQVNSNVIVSVGATSTSTVVEASASVVQGTVKDNEGAAMPGVNIVVKGTTSGTTTDGDGRFVIDARASDILVFSFIGYKPQEVEVGARSSIDIVLESDIEALKEVVVNAGYYQTTDKMKTGSIVRVGAKDIETQPVTSPLMALQGRMPGVDVTPANGVPGSAVKVQIRGVNSLRAGGGTNVNGNLPLYIIDGIPIDSRPLTPASTNLVGDGFDPLSTLSPANIESIEVLKDADATAIYGSRGANGVILITTKRGSKSERTSFDVNFYKGVGQVANHVDLMNTQQYLEMRREAFANDKVKPGSSIFSPDNDILKWDTTRYTDWQKVLLGGTAQITDMQSSLSGGSARTSFRIGGGYHKETLVFPGDFGYRRVNGFLALNHLSLDKRFNAMLSLTYGSDRNRLFDASNVVSNALNLAPNAPRLYDDSGNLNWENSTWTNPMAAFRNTHNVSTDNLVSNMVLGYEIIPRLILKSNFGYTKVDSDELIKYPISAYNPTETFRLGGVRSGDNNRKSWIVEPQLTYSANFGGGELNTVVGTTWQESDYKSELLGASGFTSDVLLGNIKAASTFTSERDDKSKYRYTALFGRLSYTWKDRYLLNLTGRRDGSSRFGPNRRFANFGSIGAGWVFSNENFAKNGLEFLSFGKVRGSYGSTGNDQIGDYKFYNTYSLTFLRYQDAVSLAPTSLYNPDYAWEVTRKLEFALEFSILENRISSEISWYRNRSSNQLVDYSLPYMTGFQSVNANFDALIENSGIEVQLRTENIKSDNVRWSSAFNLTLPKNKLVKYPGIEDSPYAYTYTVGQSLSAVKLYNLKGVDPQTGLYDVVDIDNSGTISSDFDNTYVQDLARKYYGGVINTINYKSFELSVLFQFSKQAAQSYSFAMPGRQGNQPIYVLNRWRREGDVSDVQRFSQVRNGEPVTRYSQFRNSNGLIEDASFIRLKTVSLYYDLSNVFRDRSMLQTVRVYLQGQNLLTFTSYKGLDPETQGSLPPLRMILAGIQIKI